MLDKITRSLYNMPVEKPIIWPLKHRKVYLEGGK